MTMVVDVRSDTATCPSEAMKKVMMEAKLGDDVFGEDPTVNGELMKMVKIKIVDDEDS